MLVSSSIVMQMSPIFLGFESLVVPVVVQRSATKVAQSYMVTGILLKALQAHAGHYNLFENHREVTIKRM